MQISQVSSDLRKSTFSMTSAKTAFFFSPSEIDFSVTLFRPLGKCYLLKGPSLTTLPKLLLCHSLAHNLEKAMAPHSSALAWTIPWTEEPGRLQSMGSLRVGHDCVSSLSLSAFMHWRRKWQPTPVFLPGESWGWQSLVGCHLQGRKESDTTEAT